MITSILTMAMEIVNRSAVESCNSDGNHEKYDSEFVELEKSNVLLMGPTGSGTTAGHSAALFSGAVIQKQMPSSRIFL